LTELTTGIAGPTFALGCNVESIKGSYVPFSFGQQLLFSSICRPRHPLFLLTDSLISDNSIMSFTFFLLQAGFFSYISLVAAQQIPSSPVSNKYPGVSTACQTALNTTISCPYFLQDISIE
jgi:hypothetical protein